MIVVCFNELADMGKDNTVISRITSAQVSHSSCGQKVDSCVVGSRCVGTLQGPEMVDRSIKDGFEMQFNILLGKCAVNA